MAAAASSSSSSSSTIDPNSGFCSSTKIFHSIRPRVPLPPLSLPLSAAAFAFMSSNVSSSSSAPAFIDSATGVSLSYQQLSSSVRSLSSSLRTLYSLSPNSSSSSVAFVLSPPSLHLPVLYLSLLHLGVALSPSNPSLPASEIASQLSLSKPSIIFTVSSLNSKLTTATASSSSRGDVIPKVILLDSPHFLSLLNHPHHNNTTYNNIPIEQSSAAAILYSSGTTGKLKGVVLTHRNLIAGVASFPRRATTEAADVATVAMLTVPLFHVYGFYFLLKSVVAGETAVIMTERFEVGEVMRKVDRFGVTNLITAPPALLMMVRFVEGGGRVAEGRSLRGVSCGGAPIGVELIRRFMERFPKVVLSLAYGLTESTSGAFRCIGREQSEHLGTAGRVVAGCEAKIVDPLTGAALNPCIQGELWLRGPTIMKGYIGDEGATSASIDSEGWLKTGDLCYIDREGFLFVVDRLKELIKYKGYQVPPAELEHLLQTHNEVIEAAVIPYPDEEAGEIPMAFVVRQPGSTLSEAEVMAFVAKKVAPYKRIRRVSFLQSIPKNAAGKILRKDLFKIATSKTSAKL